MSRLEQSTAKIALLLGGTSAEREISLRSGAAVAKALSNLGFNFSEIDVGPNVVQDLSQGEFTHAFNILHGRGGEDGTIQGLLEWLQIPYTGSGVTGSALAMDKLKTKQLWLGADLPTAPFVVLSKGMDFTKVIDEMEGKVMVKPVREGSSIGMASASNAEMLKTAFESAAVLDDVVIAEKWLSGKEYTACILNDKVLPIIGFHTPAEFYDYEAKYESNDNEYFIPSGLSDAADSNIRKMSLAAFTSLGCASWGRVDVMLDADDKQWLLEANTIPGMTDHSFVPMAAKAVDLDFDDLVLQILKTARLYGGIYDT